MQHGGGFVFVQMRMAIGRKVNMGQTAPQSLFRCKGLPVLIQQQAVLQSELQRSTGNAPGASVVGFRGKEVFAAPHNGAQAGEGFRIVHEQTVHIQASDKAGRAAHENGSNPQRRQHDNIGPAYPLAAVAQHVHHLIPGERGGFGLCHQAQSLMRFIRECREAHDLRFGKFQQRTVDIPRSGGVPRGQHKQHTDHEADQDEEGVAGVFLVPVHRPAPLGAEF